MSSHVLRGGLARQSSKINKLDRVLQRSQRPENIATLLGNLGALADYLAAEIGAMQRTSSEVGELRSMANRLAGDLATARHELEPLQRIPLRIRRLSKELEQLDRISCRLYRSVARIRRVPVGPLFQRFNRMVRDLARASGKKSNWQRDPVGWRSISA